MHLWEAKREVDCAMENADAKASKHTDPDFPGLCYPYENWVDFADKIGSADPHFNLAFRWDWKDGEFLVRYMLGRKGIFQSARVPVTNDDEESAREWARAKWDVIKSVWEPISSGSTAHLWEPEHPYCCNEADYFDHAARDVRHRSWDDFATTNAYMDGAVHLAFRWDWSVYQPGPDEIERLKREGRSTMASNDLTINFLDQKKGVYHSVSIIVRPSEESQVREWLEGRWGVLVKLWEPVSA